MGTPPRASVCIPSIGRTAFLPRLRKALEAQTCPDFELLILDNASPADAQDLFADWARADRRVRVLRTDPRISMFSNFDRARTAATAPFLFFCHDDDSYLPDYVKTSLEVLERSPSVGFSGSNCDYIDENDRVLEQRRWIRETQVLPGHDYIREVMRRGRNIVPMPGIAYRCAAIDARGFDDSLSCHFGDFVVLMRIAEDHDVALIEQPLIRIRRHDNQTSLSMPASKDLTMRVELMRAYIEELAAKGGSHQLVELLEQDLAQSVRVGALWGWLAAGSGPEANLCVDALRKSGPDRVLRGLLHAVDRLGLKAEVRGRYLAPFVRRVVNRTSV
jgi:glycosyltransferase involved in cell wall biosynthesis